MLSGISRFSWVFVALAVATTACDKSQLLAPTNSTISVSAATRTLPLGGSTEIQAFVIEQAGTPVQNGTTVRFVTSLGRIDPVEAQTHNGVATTTFFAGDVSGVAEVKAISGGAGAGTSTSGSTGTGTTAPTATAGNAVQIVIGAAAVDTVTVRTNPAVVSANGGTVAVIASVLGTGGRPVSGVTVTFSANRGTLSSSSAVSDANGDATVQLTTNADTQVTASAGGKTSAAATITAQPGPGVTLTCTSATSGTCATLNVGDVAVFTAARSANSSNIRSATLDFGDGTAIDLGNMSGSVSASHQYSQAGSFSVTLTATDVNGETSTARQILLVQELAQVTLSLTQTTTRRIDARATTIGCTPQRFDWNFGNGAQTQTFSTTSNEAFSTYSNGGVKTVSVSVRCTDGRTAQTSAQLTLPDQP